MRAWARCPCLLMHHFRGLEDRNETLTRQSRILKSIAIFYIQTVIDLRRSVDLLLSRRDIDRKRIGFVGHSFGAHTGVLLASVEKRIKVYVIMAGGPSLTEFLRTSTIPGVVEVRNTLTNPQQENYFTPLVRVDP